LKNLIIIKIVIFLFLFFSLVFTSSKFTIVEAQSSNPGFACGFTQPDVQFWANCSVAPFRGCRSDPTQSSMPWEWADGATTTSARFVTSPDNPLIMQVQCFVQLSFGPGCANPAYVELVNTSTNQIVRSQFKFGCDAMVTPVPDPGTYRATCYNSGRTCTASYDTFTVYPRVPPCAPAAPAAATLTAPANNATVNFGNVPLTYTLNGWGSHCPANSNTHRVEVSPGCTGVYTTNPNTTFVPSSSLVVGSTYCWRVVKNNGGSSSTSAVSRFTVIDDRVNVEPTLSGIQADVCGGGFSGAFGQSGVSNPIDFNLTFNTNPLNRYREIWLAAVPDNTPYNRACPALGGGTDISNSVCQNMESLDIVSDSTILQKARNSNAFAFKLLVDATGTIVGGSAWNGTAWTTQVSVFRANLGSATFRIKINNSLLGRYAFYTAAIITDSTGSFKGSYDTTPGAPYVFKRVNPTSTLTNWGIDLTPPVAAGTFLTPRFIDANRFQVEWNFREKNTLRLKSFIESNNSASQLQDQSSGSNIVFPANLPDQAQYNNGAIRFEDINNANGLVTQSNLGTRQYIDLDSNIQSNYQFFAYTKDAACNQRVITASASVQSPWLISYNGSVSTSKGTSGIVLPSSLNLLPSPLSSSTTNLFTDLKAVSLSTYSAISGTNDLPLSKVSRLNQFTRNYEDLAIKPPLDSGFDKWYDYVADILNRNVPSSITTLNGNRVLSSSSATLAGATAGTKRHVIINGGLIVNRGTTCNTQTIFLVKGNTTTPIDAANPSVAVRFEPDFRNANNQSGCIFITLGDILVTNGLKVSDPLAVDATPLAKYDLIEASLITDGRLTTNRDVAPANQKGDGLAIKGSVTTDTLLLRRDINLNANQFQPAQVFIFDPRYREMFKSDLSYNKYSIREVGYTSQ
jgi:hypothetical protein